MESGVIRLVNTFWHSPIPYLKDCPSIFHRSSSTLQQSLRLPTGANWSYSVRTAPLKRTGDANVKLTTPRGMTNGVHIFLC